ncbi:MAG: hypothetical protein ACE5DT_08070 [Nitrosopumilus sp.]
MSSFLLGIMLLSVFGVFILTTQGFAQSIDTPSDVNKMGALQVFDSSTNTLLGLNLGTSDSITSVILTFNSDIPDNSVVDISFRDNNDVKIGTGSTTVSPTSKTAVISLTDTVTDIERSILQSAIINVT